MKLLMAAVLFFGIAYIWGGPAGAQKSCGNCPSTVVANGVASTTAVAQTGCQDAANHSKGTCVVKVFDSLGGVAAYPTDGGPTAIVGSTIVVCPCVAQFWVHSGQWMPYSALSDFFGE